MRNLDKRIARLEAAMLATRLATRDKRDEIARNAVYHLGDGRVELLISAFGADHKGRPLSEGELAARQDYRKALNENCRAAGYGSAAGFADTPNIDHAFVFALASRMSRAELELVRSGKRVQQQGGTASEREAAAIRACELVWRRLSQLAGLVPEEDCGIPKNWQDYPIHKQAVPEATDEMKKRELDSPHGAAQDLHIVEVK